MSKKFQAVVSESLHHIFIDGGLVICLVCKKNIKEQHCTDYNILLSNHLNTKTHLHNVRALFKLCVPDWSGSYAEMIPNLVFDVTLDRNEPTFVSKTDDNFMCLVCKENIAQGTDPDVITKSIINHVKTDFHFINLKDSVFWVYPVDDEVAFIMFHKSEVHCSVCKQNVHSEITCPLNRAVHHLKVCQSIEHKIINKQQNKDDDSVVQALECLTLTDDKSSSAGTSRGLDSKLSCEYEEDECEDFVESDDDNYDESEESLNESLDMCMDALTCQECGEFIEIYNENADFSMDLHLQKHKPLMSIYTESEYDYQEDADYVCPICLETIQIFNKDLEVSIALHFAEKEHEHDRFTVEDSRDQNRFDFLSRAFDKVPDDMRDQHNVFVLDGNEVFCKLCNCIVPCSKDVSAACRVFIDHMLSTFHVHQLKTSNQFLAMAVVSYNKQSIPHENIKEENNMFEKLCKSNQTIENNKKFIEKRQIHYYCTVCEKHISYSPKENTLALNFVFHFNGEQHTNCLKKLKKMVKKSNKSVVSEEKKEMRNIVLELSKEIPAVSLNQTFITEKDSEFLCEICQESITRTGLRRHCSSHLHKTELSKRTLYYVSQLNQKKPTPKYGRILKSFLGNTIFEPHIHFINHNGEDFCCIICNISLAGSTTSGRKIKRHLFSSKHRKKCFEVTCNQDNNPQDKKKAIPSLSINSNEKSVNSKSEVSVNQKRAQKLLNALRVYSFLIKKYTHLIEARDGHFFCKTCEENIKYNSRGSWLKEHFQLKKH